MFYIILLYANKKRNFDIEIQMNRAYKKEIQ